MYLLGMPIILILFSVLQKRVFTRWWRAPEIYVNWEQYNEKVDIWSVGCIMAELILLRPLFPGLDHIDQLHKIFNIIGTPNRDIVPEICTGGLYRNSNLRF